MLLYRRWLGTSIVLMLGLLSSSGLRADSILVLYFGVQGGPTTSGRIGEYTTSGATVNASLISGPGLNSAVSFSVSGSDVFVTISGPGVPGIIGEYTLSGATVNETLISGLSPFGIAVSGSDLFVTDSNAGTIGEYTTAGAPVNPVLISGLLDIGGIAVSGSDLFLTNFNAGTIAEVATASNASMWGVGTELGTGSCCGRQTYI